MFESINPATGQVIARTPAMSADVLTAALEEAGTTAMAWARVDVSLRASMLEDVAALLEAKREEFARLITQEVGKPLVEARAELDKCALLCRYYADHAVAFLEGESSEALPKGCQVSYSPLGVVLKVTRKSGFAQLLEKPRILSTALSSRSIRRSTMGLSTMS